MMSPQSCLYFIFAAVMESSESAFHRGSKKNARQKGGTSLVL
jgi:hypothetical protein